eukprot:7138209-Prymnesium_polylepis.1
MRTRKPASTSGATAYLRSRGMRSTLRALSESSRPYRFWGANHRSRLQRVARAVVVAKVAVVARVGVAVRVAAVASLMEGKEEETGTRGAATVAAAVLVATDWVARAAVEMMAAAARAACSRAHASAFLVQRLWRQSSGSLQPRRQKEPPAPTFASSEAQDPSQALLRRWRHLHR